jgi:Mg2+-importing ATPase
MPATAEKNERAAQVPPPKAGSPAAKESGKLLELARMDAAGALKNLETSPAGLTADEAARRLEEFGPNEVAAEKSQGWPARLLHAVRNPLVVLLTGLSVVTFATAGEKSDYVSAGLMALMVVLGVGLRFIQESKADAAAAKLKAMINVTATVQREGKLEEVPLRQLAPGDVVKLAAGDMIPADVRLLSCKDLFLTQATLTGESMPVEKFDAPETRSAPSVLELSNTCFLGTSVESGTALALVAETGPRTYLGGMAKSMTGQQVQTSFDKGVHRFTWLMIKFMAVMVPAVFVIYGLTKRNWWEAFTFALAVAVGLTPEMLPMIVSVCLSKGALEMSRKKVIVKRLNSIQNFGAMDVLCTDKTGTLTMDRVILEKYCDVFQKESEVVLLDAYLISHFQTGLKNVLDRAILTHNETHQKFCVDTYRKVDEIPFDFSRRMMSVVVETPDKQNQILTKGAPEAVFDRCTHFESDDEIFPMEPILAGNLIEQYHDLSADGFRVLAVAYKNLDPRPAYAKSDECDLILKGYVAFLDPPKESASTAIAALVGHGIAVKVLTGDNELVTRKVCREVGLPTDKILLGSDVERLTEEELGQAVEVTHVFARLSPGHKKRIIETLRRRGHVVGFMGDGINDAPALRAADVGISVDNAVDIAKESADMILLEKNLMVLEAGVLEGRKVFANILKYIRMGASSNFGNMFSVLGAAALLRYLPMKPVQILTNNLLYDFSQVPIPADNVDADQIAKPRPWNIGEITRFILFIGPVSSIFDYTTFFAMLYLFHCWAPEKEHLFQSGWFVESLMTQTLIIHVIRTRKIPFIQSRASLPLTMTTLAVMGIGAWLPFSPLAGYLMLEPLPPLYWLVLFVTLVCYLSLTQVVKGWLIRKKWL